MPCQARGKVCHCPQRRPSRSRAKPWSTAQSEGWADVTALFRRTEVRPQHGQASLGVLTVSIPLQDRLPWEAVLPIGQARSLPVARGGRTLTGLLEQTLECADRLVLTRGDLPACRQSQDRRVAKKGACLRCTEPGRAATMPHRWVWTIRGLPILMDRIARMNCCWSVVSKVGAIAFALRNGETLGPTSPLYPSCIRE